MKRVIVLAGLLMLAACGSGGPPPPDWKTDAADLIARYQKHALRGENAVAERYFQQAVAATGGAGRVAETARLWLVRCATRRAMLIDDGCTEYAELAALHSDPKDQAYYSFLTLDWDALDVALLPAQHREVVRATAERRADVVAKIDDPLARLLDASLILMRREARPTTLEVATETASDQGWRQPLLTYLKIRAQRAREGGAPAEAERLERRMGLVEQSFASP